MGKIIFPSLSFILPVVLFLVNDLHGREISRRSNSKNVTDITAFLPVVSKERLHQIRLFDRMKCFPKVLCTLTKSGAFKKMGIVSLNDLADGYLRLLSAFPGGPPSPDLVETTASFKNEFDDLMHSTYSNDDVEREKSPSKGRDDDENESEELLLSDPLLHHKEKLEMKKLMADLMAEDRAEALRKPPSWASTAMSLPFKLGSTILRDVVVPYFVGDDGARRRRDINMDAYFEIQNDDRVGKAVKLGKNEDPMTSAMKQWDKLKSPQQCGRVYKACPFEAWEVVSMIKLIRNKQ